MTRVNNNDDNAYKFGGVVFRPVAGDTLCVYQHNKSGVGCVNYAQPARACNSSCALIGAIGKKR